jgi:hypothetical protein
LANDGYNSHCKGYGSDPKKKQLLHLYLTTGRNCKGKAYLEESVKLTFTEGSRHEEEWVPFAGILKKYGIAEAIRRLKKGSIAFRKDAEDPEEMEFKDSRKKTWSENAYNQSADFSKKGDIELKDYLAAKGFAGSPLAPGGGSEELAQFLDRQGQGQSQSSKDVPRLPGQGQDQGQTSTGAIAVPMSDNEDDDDFEAEHHNKLGKKADELSQIGTLASKKVSQRLQDMLKVCNAMKSHIECESLGKNMKPSVMTAMKAVLDKLSHSAGLLKKGILKPPNMEKAKDILTASAKSINEGKIFVAKL